MDDISELLEEFRNDQAMDEFDVTEIDNKQLGDPEALRVTTQDGAFVEAEE